METCYNKTVAVWYSSHYQNDSRDWDNIEEFKGEYHPLLGYYKSDDPEVIKKHLHWMRRAGIDLIVYNIFSGGTWNLTDIEKDRALPILINELVHQENEGRKLKICFWLEKYCSNPTIEQYRFALDYIRKYYSEQDYYFHYNGKPLVLAYLNLEAPSFDQIEYENTYFELRRTRAYYTDTWSYIEHYPQMLRRDWMSAAPGFNAYLENAYLAKQAVVDEIPDYEKIYAEAPKADRENGEYFRRQLLWAAEHNPDILFLSGWNDWQYANQIEPAVEYKFQYLDLVSEVLGREEETFPYRDED